MTHAVVWTIGIGVVLAIALFASVAATRDILWGPWKLFSSRYPHQPLGREHLRSAGRVYLCKRRSWERMHHGMGCSGWLTMPLWFFFRGWECYRVTSMDDGRFLHLEIPGGKFVKGRTISIPWAAAQRRPTPSASTGDSVTFFLEDLVVIVRRSMIKRETEEYESERRMSGRTGGCP